MKNKILLINLIYVLPLSLLSSCTKNDVSNDISTDIISKEESILDNESSNETESSSSINVEPTIRNYYLHILSNLDFNSKIIITDKDNVVTDDYSSFGFNNKINGNIEYTKDDTTNINLDNTDILFSLSYYDKIDNNTNINASLKGNKLTLNDNIINLDASTLDYIADFLESYVDNATSSNVLNLTNMIPISAVLTNINSFLNEDEKQTTIINLIKQLPEIGTYLDEDSLSSILLSIKEAYDLLPFMIQIESKVISGIDLTFKLDYDMFVSSLFSKYSYLESLRSYLPDKLDLSFNIHISSLGHLNKIGLIFKTIGKIDNPNEEIKNVSYDISLKGELSL